MLKKDFSRNLAEKAIALLNLAEKYENQQLWAKAIQSYSEAAELLKQSGLIVHRIDDIYNRMTYLNQILQQDKQYQRQKVKAQFTSLQDQAFQLLDQAKNLEKKRRYKDSISQYTAAINLLAQAGWDESQLGKIKEKLGQLVEAIKQQQVIEKERTAQIAQIQVEEGKAFGVPEAAVKSTALDGTSKLRLEFEAKKRQEEDYQNKAFASIDEGKELLRKKEFEAAKEKYYEAVELLKEIGWTEQNIGNLVAEIESIEKQRIAFEKAIAKKPAPTIQTAPIPEISQVEIKTPITQEITTESIMGYEAKKKFETETQEKAFKLMDEGDKLASSKQFDEAIEKYGMAAQYLKSVGWEDQLVHIKTIIDKINADKANFESILAKQAKEKEIVQVFSQPELSAQYTTEIEKKESKLRDFEETKKREEDVQNKAFILIDTAKRLERERDYDKAIAEFNEAIDLLKSIGWDAHIQPIKKFIADIKEKQKRQQKAREQQQAREEEYLRFQKMMKEREKILVEDEVKGAVLKKKEFEDAQKVERMKEDKAFKLINEADELVKTGDYEAAINSYLKAGDIFKEIGWTDQIATIQIIIKTVEQKKEEFLKRERKASELKEKQRKEEEEFRSTIVEEIRQEKEKLKEKRFIVREAKKEQQYLENRKSEAFKILDEAESLTVDGNFDGAIEKYHAAAIILAEIQWTEELKLIQGSIKELEKKRKERKEWEQKIREDQIKREKEEREFQEKIAIELEKERKKLREKEIAFREYEKEVEYREKRRDEAFIILDEAKELTISGKFDKAIEKYHKASMIFSEIQWKEELRLIQIAIQELENKKREKELWKQRELEEGLKKEQEEREFQRLIADELKKERQKLKEKQIAVREYEKEVEYRENRKQAAFKILNEAERLTISGDFNGAIEKYHEASVIFAEIRWKDELAIIQNAIIELEKSKKERELWEQKLREESIKKEQEAREYQEIISKSKKEREEQVKMSRYIQRQQKILSEQNLKRQNKALKTLDVADEQIKKGNLDDAINIYETAIQIFNEIGWEGPYLKVIQETLENLNKRKMVLEKIYQKQKEAESKRELEEKEFQSMIATSLEKEKQKMLAKKIAIQTREQEIAYREKRREEAFKILDDAEKLTRKGKFDEALASYRQADIMLNEIQFPSHVIAQMIEKVKQKQKERKEAEQREREYQIRREMEEREFQTELANQLEREREKMKAKKIEVINIEKMRDARESRREEAFEVLSEAERLTKSGNFDLAIETYRKAALILSEIQYPVDSIHATINKVQLKKSEKERIKQQEIEATLLKEKEERQLQEEIAQQIQLEKENMKAKRIAIKTQEKIKHYREKKREEAFKVLEDAEKLTKTGNFDQAIGSYRQAALILSEIQYPLDSIHEMIKKVQIKKVEQDQLKQQELESQLLKQKEEAALQEIIEERKRQETELKKKKLAATKEREELIAKTESRREAAFSILEKADNFLKKFPPDFDNAIELYLEAKKILLEINWEPEIKNLDDLISNLRQEKQKFAIQQKQEEEAQLRAAEEYKRYQQEILREKLEVQRTKEEQLKKFREFKLEQETREKYQHEGLAYLDVAKKSVSMHQYNIAYEQFEQAIEKFEAIGWIEQIKYIKNEIENTKKAEANFIKAQEQVRLAHEALLKQKELKEQRKKEEEEEQRKSIKTISVLSDDLVESLKQQRIEREEAEETKIKKLKKESTSFGKEMGKLIQLKHELMEELEKAEEEEKKKQVAVEKKKGKKELDDISKMIREASKKE